MTTPKPIDRDYTTPSELRSFDAMRESGEVSIYREGKCEKCPRVIPKAFRFCSAACAGVAPAQVVGDEDDVIED